MSRLFDGKIECQWPEACMKIEDHFITALSITCVNQGLHLGSYTRPPKLWIAKIEVQEKKAFENVVEGKGATLEEALADAEKQAQAFNQKYRVPD